MGSQLFPTTLGFGGPVQQTGPTPLQVLLASPLHFVKETTQHNTYDAGLNELEPSAKRRKVMSLAEYRARKSGIPYVIQAVSEGQEQVMEDGKRKLPKPQAITQKEIYSPQESTSEPHAPAVPEVIPTKPLHVEETKGDQKEGFAESRLNGVSENRVVSNPTSVDPTTAEGTTETSKSDSEEPASSEISRKRRSISPADEVQSPAKKLKTSEVAAPTKVKDSPEMTGIQNKAANGLKAKITKTTSKDTQTHGSPVMSKKLQDDVKTVNGAASPFPKEFPARLQNVTARGITNKGLWCYRNSIIQALVHVPAIYGYLSTNNQPGGDECPRPGRSCICCLLREFTKIHFSETKGINRKQRALELIDKMLGGEFANIGHRHEQQDADEYAIRMLDKAVEQQKKGKKKGKTVLEQLLEITTAQDVICSNKACKHRSQTKSYNTSVRAKMPRTQTAVRLNDLVNDLEASETIKDYKCEKCGKLGATIKRRFTELPPALMVHVNRGGKANFRGQAVKLNNWLQFEPEMHLRTNDGVSHKYVLRSVVSHFGSSLNSGHYVCFGRNPNKTSWSMCDDSSVTQTSEAKFRGGKEGRPRFSAYILMYGKA